MKTFTKFLTMLAVAALFATGCVNEEPPYKEDPNPEPAGMTGYLSIGNLSMTVVYDETEIRPDDTSDETQAARTASGTRATAPDVDSFIVEILDDADAQVLEMTYAELKEQLKTPMELKVGAYRMEVRSEDTMPGADWEHPVYGATSDFTITKAQTTSPEEVVCTLQNIKVSVEYSPELADMLADTSKATVSLGDTSLDFPKTETRAAYFKPQALENTLDFAFDGTFADTGVPAKFSKQITGVKAGQWRKVSVVIGYADKGNILFSVKVDNSILQDNKFVVDGTENLGEELLEDPNAPALTWPGHDMTQPFTLTDAMFDAEGNCIEPFAFDLSSPNGIESLQVTVGSTNSQFLASMSAIQLPQTFDLCALDASSAAGIILKGFGYPVGSELKGQTAKSFNIAGQIRALYEFDGTHTFAFTMTDAKGVSSEAVLTLVVDKSSGQTGPRITWRGYDIDQQYEVQKDMVIDIDIEADKGIKSFFVTIDSETLRPLLPVITSGAAATTRSPRNSVPVTRPCRDASGHTVPNCPRHIIRWPRFPHRATYSRETSPSRFSAGWAATSLSAKSSLTTPAREPSGSNTTLRSGKSTTISMAGKFPSAKWTRPGYSSASWTGRPNRKYLPGQKPRRAPGIRRHKPKRPTAPSSGMPPNSSKKRPRAMKW